MSPVSPLRGVVCISDLRWALGAVVGFVILSFAAAALVALWLGNRPRP